MCGLRLGDAEEDRIDLLDCQVGVAADLELDQRGAAVRRDLTPISGVERGADVRHRGLPGEGAEDGAYRGLERRVVRLQRVALNQDALTGRLLEALVENCERAARFAWSREVGCLLCPDDEHANCERDEDEGEPPEDRDLAVMSAPAAHATGQVRGASGFDSVVVALRRFVGLGRGDTTVHRCSFPVREGLRSPVRSTSERRLGVASSASAAPSSREGRIGRPPPRWWW